MASEVEEVFKKHKVLPDVISKPPKHFLKVSISNITTTNIGTNDFNFKITYSGDLNADQGQELTPTQVKNSPKVEWDGEPSALYTLIMTDPDAPSRKEPKFREYQHWLVINIPGNDIDKGDVITAYVGSGPPKGTGLHRYVFLVFKQPGPLKISEPHIKKNSGANRGSFNTVKFTTKYKLGDAIAGNFYQAKWDDYVPTVHRQLSGK